MLSLEASGDGGSCDCLPSKAPREFPLLGTFLGGSSTERSADTGGRKEGKEGQRDGPKSERAWKRERNQRDGFSLNMYQNLF